MAKEQTYKLKLDDWEILAVEKALEFFRDNSYIHKYEDFRYTPIDLLLGRIRDSATEIRAKGERKNA